MYTFFLIDTNLSFLEDVRTTQAIEEYPCRIECFSNLEDAAGKSEEIPDLYFIVGEYALTDKEHGDIPEIMDGRIYGFSNNADHEAILALKIPYLGLFRTSQALLQELSRHNFKKRSEQQQAKKQSFLHDNAQGKKTIRQPEQHISENIPQEAPPKKTPVSETKSSPQNPNTQFPITPEMMAMFAQFMAGMTQTPTTPQPLSSASSINESTNINDNSPIMENDNTGFEDDDDGEEDVENKQTSVKPAAKPKPAKSKIKTERIAKRMKAAQQEKADADTDNAIDQDLYPHLKEHKTTVVSVYAAKGGVGKTSIATELAVYLALTTNGRRRLRVCIVDYNVDFGDVSTMLEFDDNGPNLANWAMEINALLEDGKNPDDIHVTRKEMENRYLQKMDATGLYALCAPVAHEDSMLIKPAALEIMLRNIVENGEFDFVICDTGNNTRDSSIIALDHSQYVLLVVTQDLTTANCNASVLRTLQDAGFNTAEKIRLVINNVMPSRETGISTSEVEESFHFPCVCRIRHTCDIIKANNLSRPLVYKPNHEYTKQIQKIVKYITQGIIDAPPKKKGFFARLFHRE